MKPGDLFKQLQLAIWTRDGGICGLCGEPVDLDNMHLDHTIAARDGGPTVVENLRCTHGVCNQRRSALETHAIMRARAPERTVTINLRLPNDLEQDLKKLAEADERSLNTYIVRALRVHADLARAHKRQALNPSPVEGG